MYSSIFVECKYCAGISYVQSIFSLPSETWQLHGDAIWRPLCAPLNVTILNLLWVDLQRVLLCSVSYIWTVCLQVPRYYMQVYFNFFFYFMDPKREEISSFLALCFRFPKSFLQHKLWFLLVLKRKYGV